MERQRWMSVGAPLDMMRRQQSAFKHFKGFGRRVGVWAGGVCVCPPVDFCWGGQSKCISPRAMCVLKISLDFFFSCLPPLLVLPPLRFSSKNTCFWKKGRAALQPRLPARQHERFCASIRVAWVPRAFDLPDQKKKMSMPLFTARLRSPRRTLATRCG